MRQTTERSADSRLKNARQSFDGLGRQKESEIATDIIYRAEESPDSDIGIKLVGVVLLYLTHTGRDFENKVRIPFAVQMRYCPLVDLRFRRIMA